MIKNYSIKIKNEKPLFADFKQWDSKELLIYTEINNLYIYDIEQNETQLFHSNVKLDSSDFLPLF